MVCVPGIPPKCRIISGVTSPRSAESHRGSRLGKGQETRPDPCARRRPRVQAGRNDALCVPGIPRNVKEQDLAPSRVSCSELLGGMPGLQTEASVRIGFSGLGLLWLYRRRLGLKEFGETLFSPSRIWAASLT